MLRSSSLLVLIACAAAPTPVAEYPALAPEPEAVASVLDRMHLAAGEADEETYFGCYSEDSIFMGTDATERWTKAEFQAYAHPFFARGSAWAFRAVRREIIFSETNALAWFDEDLETNALGPARGSGVLRRDADGRWLVVHYNLALTIPNERFSEVFTLLSGSGDTADEENEAASDVANEE
ncbi:MAG: ketosteroid isomerase-like protein [Polyangiales bacterium]|jgi:ketosteroid isomerase-like protein